MGLKWKFRWYEVKEDWFSVGGYYECILLKKYSLFDWVGWFCCFSDFFKIFCLFLLDM